MKVDFIIVGQGLAGSALAMALLRRGKTILVIDRGDPSAATRMAAGLVTTLAGKGMNPAWRQTEYLPEAMAYYKALEENSGEKIFYELPVLRLFGNDKERAKFERKKAGLKGWVAEENPEIDQAQLNADFGGFEMSHGGRLDTCKYLKVVRSEIEKLAEFREDDFSEDDLTFTDSGVVWKEVQAEKIILCQGYSGLAKGSFSNVVHRSAKGEMLTVKIDALDSDRIISSNGWMVPLGDNFWRAGATYEWDDLDTQPTAKGEDLVRKKIAEVTPCAFELVKHEAGIRPIIHRSQPVIGWHAEYPHLGFFNGLGSKGVITAPSVGEHFAEHLCGGSELDPELSLERLYTT